MASHLIADYTLGAVLGVGTVGTIYEATENDTGEVYAIKKLHPGICQDQLIRARFKREMTILQRLGHPNIIGYFGGGESEDGQLYYIMELVKGGTVKELIEKQGRLSWEVVVDIARQLCSALQCAHNHGVIHRDLKPGNLFLTTSAIVKLGDFGIARDTTAADLTSSGLTVGTHAYMSPEQITGDSHLSGKTDLYALGCCLYEMLTGQKPFRGEHFAQLFEQHLKAEPPHVRDSVSECPEELDAMIVHLLQKDAERRPFNARQVQATMLQIGEKYGLASENHPKDPSQDVGAASVTEKGHELLRQQIGASRQPSVAPEVGWGRLAIVLAVVVCIVIAALALKPLH